MTRINVHSDDWLAVQAWAESALSSQLQALEIFDLPAPETERVRARIALLRELIALPSASPDAPKQAPGDVYC